MSLMFAGSTMNSMTVNGMGLDDFSKNVDGIIAAMKAAHLVGQANEKMLTAHAGHESKSVVTGGSKAAEAGTQLG